MKEGYLKGGMRIFEREEEYFKIGKGHFQFVWREYQYICQYCILQLYMCRSAKQCVLQCTPFCSSVHVLCGVVYKCRSAQYCVLQLYMCRSVQYCVLQCTSLCSSVHVLSAVVYMCRSAKHCVLQLFMCRSAQYCVLQLYMCRSAQYCVLQCSSLCSSVHVLCTVVYIIVQQFTCIECCSVHHCVVRYMYSVLQCTSLCSSVHVLSAVVYIIVK